MAMNIAEYVSKIQKRYKTGISREHSYRGDLEQLLQHILPHLLITNEPARIECGAPDYILTKGSIPIGYIEAKDIGESLTSKKHKEQFDRYKASLPNLIFTDYLDFHFYQEGEFITSVSIADLRDGKIIPKSDNFEQFESLIKDFGTHMGRTIKSSSKLSKMMAGKARLLANIIENALNADEQKGEAVNKSANNTLREQLKAFQNVLISDIKAKDFADIYAQTIAYGMFAARLHDPTLDTFSRQEAAELIPKTNPFLRKLFQYIAGYDLDDRIAWVVDGLADIFRATDVDGLLKNFGKATQQHDPIIHFYETFLAEYDPKLRKSRGVWYTPEPVVNFIVRAVDDILKDEFGLKDGLADTSKTKIKVNTDVVDKRSATGYKQEEREVHKVQILDPAAGTGTFLAEVVKNIHSRFEGQEGIWSQYVEDHLIPRLNGFEILMASYAMAHLKLDLLLKETGYESPGTQRFRVYLTNSLEEHHPDTGTLFASWLSEEANEANHIKRDTPVMVVLGNPPYSVKSSNNGKWIKNLLNTYKKEPGGKSKLQERNPKSINDDYVKFIRYSQYIIEKNSEGILAFITPHGYIENPTFRGMRWQILKSYDHGYIIDLHGNSTKKETAPDGSIDENVFDIRQGVAISIYVKKSANDKLANLYHADLYGNRSTKYAFLNNHSLKEIAFQKVNYQKNMYFFQPKDYSKQKKYKKWPIISDLFKNYGMGITTGNDNDLISFNKDFKNIDEFDKKYIQKYSYRLFDNRFLYNDSDLVERNRSDLMANFSIDRNIALFSLKRTRRNHSNKFFLTKYKSDKSCISTLDNGYVFPLYIYDDSLNIHSNINDRYLRILLNNNDSLINSVKEYPINLIDYVYAILFSSKYRVAFEEFLKVDFPRIPNPNNSEQFWQLVELGGQLRQIHLMEHDVLDKPITTYPVSGSNEITNRLTKNDPGFEPEEDNPKIGKVWINDEQYFGNVPLKAWEFYIGGYQPAEKWLKDRRDRVLSFEEIQHYQKIIVALMETDRIMQEIDEVDFMG